MSSALPQDKTSSARAPRDRQHGMFDGEKWPLIFVH